MDSGYARLPGEDAEAHCARLLQLLQGGSTPEEDEGSNEADWLEVAEAMLAQKSTEKQSPMVLELLKNLQQCAVPGMRLDAACCAFRERLIPWWLDFGRFYNLTKRHVIILYVVGGFSFFFSISWISFLSTFCLISCPECSNLNLALGFVEAPFWWRVWGLHWHPQFRDEQEALERLRAKLLGIHWLSRPTTAQQLVLLVDRGNRKDPPKKWRMKHRGVDELWRSLAKSMSSTPSAIASHAFFKYPYNSLYIIKHTWNVHLLYIHC